MVAQIQMRRDSAADWTSANPVLAEGEFGFETDTLKYKIGDGSTGWNSLKYGVFDGFAPGKRFQFSTTTTDSDPGAGFLRLNNATPASATQIFIDNADYAGATVTAWLNRLDNFGDTTDRGILLIQRASDPDVYLEYQVTGSVVDGTGYRKLSVTHLASAGSIFNNDILSVTFLPAGVASSGDFKADGTVPMTDDLDMGGNGLVDVVSINGGQIAGFRNIIINGNFDIWQRGTSLSGFGYLADRWQVQGAGSTFVQSRQTFALGQTDVPREPEYFHRTVVTSVAGAANYAVFVQRIEDVRTFAGQNVVLSFWAKANASKNACVEFVQLFGSGGSTQVNVSPSNTIALTTSWQKFTVTKSIPSISGKTIGSDNNDCFIFHLWLDAGSNFNARLNSLGQQSGTFDIAQVQLEAGDNATPFEHRSIGQELALCQRYYETGTLKNYRTGMETGYLVASMTFRSVKRAAPSLVFSGAPIGAVLPTTIEWVNTDSFGVYGSSSYGLTFSWTASAEL